ncbi:MAG: hypothetical protein IPO58_00970 [Betaproteobacteria bacterium]|nr:hypothetical protein [Betaproteobacteria bacterium]
MKTLQASGFRQQASRERDATGHGSAGADGPHPQRSALALLGAACAVSLLINIGAHAQVCSGGPDGGMDATGNQCNQPDGAGLAVVGSEAQPHPSRVQGLAEYEAGHYVRAAELFRVAAEQGDVRSAEMLTMMYRQGSRLYGNGFPADMQLAIHWARKAAAYKTRVGFASSQ